MQPATPEDAPTNPSNPALADSTTVASVASILQLFSSIVQHNQQLSAQVPGNPPPLIPPAPPTFPAFISTDTSPAGKSLPSLFPAIETSVLLDIARHEFRPIDLCKLDSRFRNKADVERLDSAAPCVGAFKEYPSLHSLLVPLTTYFAILQAFSASAGDAHATFLIGNSAARYTAHLLELHQHYEWTAVLQYHMQFHLHRRQEMLSGSYAGWAQPDQLLMSQYLFGRMRAAGGASSSRSGSGKSKRDVSAETCFAFNKGSCSTSPCPDGRVHKCRKCGASDHGEKTCKKS
ncbi:hypothetical protein LshimejAT787_0209650 [Lyophyllum shimeji]|uniref:Uncharacterized protein n=1 Tax=Lyophyllum shimeji TaxID=47721 RepID=A0A9P3PG35_LYOSH|nr:hypothetical protein LshimejAT787_0209650 [Lyophyllum shimeji]